MAFLSTSNWKHQILEMSFDFEFQKGHQLCKSANLHSHKPLKNQIAYKVGFYLWNRVFVLQNLWGRRVPNTNMKIRQRWRNGCEGCVCSGRLSSPVLIFFLFSLFTKCSFHRFVVYFQRCGHHIPAHTLLHFWIRWK